MSRVVHINDSIQAVTDLCEKLSVAISTIEPLQSGGTRVVLNNSVDAEKVVKRATTKVIDGPVVRSPLHAWRSSAPFR